ncbi:MAG: hypothetical protein K6E98_09100 [Lachnospiraceae bacterium]|nr:hypothetical protein [Lachnospiraceae bacterium]
MNIKTLSPLRKKIYDAKLRFRFINEYLNIISRSGSRLPQKRLKKFLTYAKEHCRYYRALNCDPADLSSFPLLTKEIVSKNYKDITSDEAKNIIYRESYTGGSTGEPFHFMNQMDLDPIYQVVLWQRMGYRPGDTILSMDGTKLSEESLVQNIYWGKKAKRNLPYGGYFMSSLYLNEDNISLYVDHIMKLKPDFIRAYPMFIYTVAKYMKDNNIKPLHKTKGIQLTSESSFTYQHDLIEEVFDTTVYMQYGHTECCAFAYTKDSSRIYRTEPLYGFMEILNEEGIFVKPGETGEIVVTSFFNKVMPLIRYKTGDMAEFSGYDGNSLILKKIEGRTQDYVIDNNGHKVMITALIMAQHLAALGHIRKWQIEQTVKGAVTMRIIKGNDYTEASEKEISTLFINNAGITTQFEYVDSLSLTSRGKSKLIIQHL